MPTKCLAVPAKHSIGAGSGREDHRCAGLGHETCDVCPHHFRRERQWHRRVCQRLPLPLSSAPVLGGALSTDLVLRRACMRQAPHLESRSRPRARGHKIICIAASINSSLLHAIVAACARFTAVKGETLSVRIFAQRTSVTLSLLSEPDRSAHSTPIPR